MNNPYGLGFGFYGGHPLDTTIQLVEESEKVGMDSCWIAEDYFYGGAFSTAAVCAANTHRIQIGIGVINPFTRHPLLSAMEAASLDVIAKGRILLGLGAGNRRWMEELVKADYQKPIQATKEAAMIIKELLRNRQIHFEGEVFQTGEVHLDITPFRPDLPVIMGVKGPKALYAAGQIADGVLLSTMTSIGYVAYAREQIRKGAESVGRDPSEIKIAAYFPMHVDSDSHKAKEQVKDVVAQFIGVHGIHPIMLEAGLSESYLKPFRQALLEGDTKRMIPQVTDEVVENLCIAGTPAECRDRLKKLNEAGVDMPIAFEIPSVSPMDSLRLIAKAVLD